MHFHIITLFPEAFDSYLKASIIGRAIKDKKIKVSFYNPRDFTKDSKRRVDRKPYGGGPGMVIEAFPVIQAVKKAIGKKKKVKVIFFSASAIGFDSKKAIQLSKKYKHIVLISGHYEGVDERVRKATNAEEISIGPYILTGGELPALVIVDAVSRHVRGVLGNIASLEEYRDVRGEVYTRPEVFSIKGKKYKVPNVLTSGHHKKIEEWRKKIKN